MSFISKFSVEKRNLFFADKCIRVTLSLSKDTELDAVDCRCCGSILSFLQRSRRILWFDFVANWTVVCEKFFICERPFCPKAFIFLKKLFPCRFL